MFGRPAENFKLGFFNWFVSKVLSEAELQGLLLVNDRTTNCVINYHIQFFDIEVNAVQYSCMHYLWRHSAFSCLCIIVVCITYDFLQKRAIAQKFKMADLDSCHSLKWHNILHCLLKVYTQKVNNIFEIEDEKCHKYTWDFPVSAI